MSLFPHQPTSFSDIARDRLGRQVSALSDEVGSISEAIQKLARRTSREAGHIARDVTEEALHHGAAAARGLARSAGKATRAVKHDPLPAVAIVVGIACLFSLLHDHDS